MGTHDAVSSDGLARSKSCQSRLHPDTQTQSQSLPQPHASLPFGRLAQNTVWLRSLTLPSTTRRPFLKEHNPQRTGTRCAAVRHASTTGPAGCAKTQGMPRRPHVAQQPGPTSPLLAAALLLPYCEPGETRPASDSLPDAQSTSLAANPQRTTCSAKRLRESRPRAHRDPPAGARARHAAGHGFARVPHSSSLGGVPTIVEVGHPLLVGRHGGGSARFTSPEE